MCISPWWVLGLVGIVAIAFRHFEYDVLRVHKSQCEERHKINSVLLGSSMCDKGANELAFRDKVQCDKARKENAWGIGVCTLSSRLSDNTIAEALAYARDSWYVFVFAALVVVVAIRQYLSSRAEVAKHKASMDALERMAPKFAQQQQTHIEQPSRQRLGGGYQQHRGVPALQSYRRDQHGRLVHSDTRSAYYTLGN